MLPKFKGQQAQITIWVTRVTQLFNEANAKIRALSWWHMVGSGHSSISLLENRPGHEGPGATDQRQVRAGDDGVEVAGHQIARQVGQRSQGRLQPPAQTDRTWNRPKSPLMTSLGGPRNGIHWKAVQTDAELDREKCWRNVEMVRLPSYWRSRWLR